MAMTWKFVERPEAGSPVRLDMSNGADWWMSGEGFDVSPPPLRRSIAQNNLTNGGLVTAALYDLRELKFTLELRGATENDRNAQLADLKRELSRTSPGLGADNLLMFKPERGTYPVFFRTFHTNYVLDTQLVPGTKWRVTCSVLAEPFAIGERHDIVSSQVVGNNPASGAAPTYFDIAGIKGDAASPAFARVGSGFGAGATFHVAQRTNSPAAVTVWAQCEGGTLGTDTTTQPNDATMSGSGNNFVRCTFATNTLVGRVTVTVPTATSSDALRGKYRVYVKVRRSAGTAFTLRYRVPGGSATFGPSVSYSTTMQNAWLLDLGIVDMPSPGPAPQSVGYSGLSAGFAPQALEIQALRVSGTSTLDMDYVYLLPADEGQCSFQQVAVTGYDVLDGPNDAMYGMAAGTSPFDPLVANRTVDNNGGLLPKSSGLPYLVPGVTNRWYVLRTPHDVTASSTWNVSYWPFWLEVATS